MATSTPGSSSPAFSPEDTSRMVHDALKRATAGNTANARPAKKEEPAEYKRKETTATKGQVMFSELTKAKVAHDFPVTVLDKKSIPKEISALVPELDPAYEVQVEQAYYLLLAWESGDKTLMAGPTGSGKSSLVKYCAALTNRPFVRINMNGDIESSSIFGQLVVEGGALVWKDGAATEAIKYGAVLLVDEWEIMPPEVGMGFQNVLEDKGYLFLKEMPGTSKEKMIIPHQQARIVYAGNTLGQGDDTGRFAGVAVQNTATIDRFQTTIILDYLSTEHETKVLKNTVPDLQESTIVRMLQFASLVRTAYNQGNIALTCSPRTLINWGRKIVQLADIKVALDYAFINKLGTSDKKVVSEMRMKVFGR
jgi:cobaltochelatase CobS